MSINRFSRGPIAADVQSKFMPMPLDMIDRQVQRRQSSYDTAKATIGAGSEAVMGAQGLSQDQETLKGISDQYDTRIEKAIDEAGGDYSRLTAFSDTLSHDITKDMRSGQLGAIQNNFAKAQKHMSETAESFKKGDISKSGYDRAMSSISGFGGTVEDGKGGYTQASLYLPTKYMDMTATADKYGAVIKDQYDAKGQKFVSVGKAREYITNNLWNNPQLIANAKEQIWATYGDVDPQTEQKLVTQFLNTVGNNAAVKVAFQQIHKPEGENELTGNPMFSYEIQGAKPMGSRVFSADGQDFVDVINNAKEKGEMSIWQTIKLGASYLSIAGSVYGVTEDGRSKKTEQIEKYKAQNDKALKQAVKEVASSDLAKDMAGMAGITLDENTSYEDIIKMSELMEGVNNSSASTRPVWQLGKRQKIEFEGMVNSGAFINMRVMDVDTGEPIRKEDKDALFLRHKAMQKDGGFALEYAGTIIDGSGQPYGEGTTFIKGLDNNGTPKVYAIESSQSGTQSYYEDRLEYAKNAGFASYRSGGQLISMMPTKNGTRVYINNKYVKTEQ